MFRDSRIVQNEEWVKTPEGAVAEVVWTTPGIWRATLLLSVAGQPVDLHRVADRPASSMTPRLSGHAAIDPDLQELTRSLRGEGGKTGKDFETGVDLLLHLCGFSIAPYHQLPQLQDAPDILAFYSEGSTVLVVECTLREIDAKLSKLHRRTQQIAEYLLGSRVVLLLFTSLERAQIPEPDHERAAKAGIAVLAAEDIEKLLVSVSVGRSASEVIQDLGS